MLVQKLSKNYKYVMHNLKNYKNITHTHRNTDWKQVIQMEIFLAVIYHQQEAKCFVKWSCFSFVSISKLVRAGFCYFLNLEIQKNYSLNHLNGCNLKWGQYFFSVRFCFVGVSWKAHRVNRYQLVLGQALIHIKYLNSHPLLYQNMIQIFHYAKQVNYFQCNFRCMQKSKHVFRANQTTKTSRCK